MKNKPFLLATVFSFFMAAFLATACYSQNGVVSPKDQVPIPQGQNTGIWKGRDIRVEYSYSRGQSDMSLAGTVLFEDNMTLGYSLLDNFQISAIFVDENGRVLTSQSVATQRGSLDPFRFQKRLVVPSAAAGMSFSYQGVAIESGTDGGNGRTSFWQTPVH